MKNKIAFNIMLAVFLSLTATCSKEEVGYIEVRNFLDREITSVAWGDVVSLGTIAPGEEEGQETADFGTHYIQLNYMGVSYRSVDPVQVDVFSSATFILEDMENLVEEVSGR